MVSYSAGPGFNHFCGSSLVEPACWCGDANLDYRLVRSDNGRSGDHFWLSLAQLGDAGNPLINANVFSPVSKRTVLRFVKAVLSARKLFVRLNPMAAGLLKKMQPEMVNWPITLRRWNMIVPISRLDFAMVSRGPFLRVPPYEKSSPY